MLALVTGAKTVLVFAVTWSDFGTGGAAIADARCVLHLPMCVYWAPGEVDDAHILCADATRKQHCVVNVHSGAAAVVTTAAELGDGTLSLFPFHVIDTASRRLWVANYSNCVGCVRLPVL